MILALRYANYQQSFRRHSITLGDGTCLQPFELVKSLTSFRNSGCSWDRDELLLEGTNPCSASPVKKQDDVSTQNGRQRIRKNSNG